MTDQEVIQQLQKIANTPVPPAPDPASAPGPILRKMLAYEQQVADEGRPVDAGEMMIALCTILDQRDWEVHAAKVHMAQQQLLRLTGKLDPGVES